MQTLNKPTNSCGFNEHGRVSFGDVVKGQKPEQKTPMVPKVSLESSNNETWLNKLLIGEVNSYENLINIRSIYSTKGMMEFSIKSIKYMGGMNIVLVFVDNQSAMCMLNLGVENWSRCFTRLSP